MFELRYYRRKLTKEEVQQWRWDHMDSVNPGPEPTHAPAILQYSADGEHWQSVPVVKE